EPTPLAPLCTHTLYAEVGEASFTDFWAAPLALLNALVVEVAARSSSSALRRLKQLDDLLAERGYLFRARRAGAAGVGGASAGKPIVRGGKAINTDRPSDGSPGSP